MNSTARKFVLSPVGILRVVALLFQVAVLISIFYIAPSGVPLESLDDREFAFFTLALATILITSVLYLVLLLSRDFTKYKIHVLVADCLCIVICFVNGGFWIRDSIYYQGYLNVQAFHSATANSFICAVVLILDVFLWSLARF